MKSRMSIAALSLVGALSLGGAASAKVAGGTTTTGVSVIESTQLALGWSVKKTLLGKTIYNEHGQKVGKVEDLIIAPDKKVSYVIVGAGGFVGIGRHDVAVPVTQIEDQSGKLVMPGATQDMIKAMPRFDYADDSARRKQFISVSEQEIAKGKAQIAELNKKAGVAAADAKVRINAQITALQADVTSAEAKLAELKKATVKRWREFESGVSAATVRVRKSIDAAVG